MMAGIIYVGCTSTTRAIIEAHIKSHPDIPIAGIVSLSPKNKPGKINYDNLMSFSSELNVHACESINNPTILDWIRKQKPTLIIQSGWSGKFGNELLAIPKYGCIGQHPSPLPRGRGAAALNWAIINGETSWGNTFFRMTEEYDAGEIYNQSAFPIRLDDTYKTLLEKVDMLSSLAIKHLLSKWYQGELIPLKQDETKMTYYGKRTPEMGLMSPFWPTEKIKRYVRALTKPCNGAYFVIRSGAKIYVWDHNDIVEEQ